MIRRYAANALALVLAAACFFNLASASENIVKPELPAGRPIAVGDTGEVVWSEGSFNGGQRYFYSRWNPATGQVKKLPLPTECLAEAAASNKSGLALMGQTVIFPAKDGLPNVFWLVTAQDKVLSTALPVQRRSAHLLSLSDGSFLIVGGKLIGGEQRTSAVERISFAGDRLLVERLPDIPGALRAGYTLVALADGRAMVLGGSTAEYLGMEPYFPDTFILDPKSKAWVNGPKMVVPRAYASANLLPDGRVLVAGGWSPGHGWNEHADNRTEIWDAASNSSKLAAPMPVGVAMHQTMWAAGQQGKELLLAGGMLKAWEGSAVVLAFDLSSNEWRMVGQGYNADSHEGTLRFGSVIDHDKTYFWCDTGLSGRTFYELRLTSDTPPTIIGESGLVTGRAGSIFLPAQGDRPALSIGGQISGVDSAAVDAIWPDGRIQAMASLNFARTGGHGFRLADGSVLVMGGIDSSPRTEPGSRTSPQTEWWAGGANPQQSRWITLDFGLESDAVVGQTSNGDLIVVHADGRVERIAVTLTHGKPQLQTIELPHLNRKRRVGVANPFDEVQVRGLPDGRIIVAGGDVQVDQIALMQEDSMRADSRDTYIGIGEYLPARRYETYEPTSKTWINSTASHGAGGGGVILDDGRVVRMKRSKIAGAQKKDGTWPVESGLLEVSSADGKTWHGFNAAEFPLATLGDQARLFIIDRELFLSGQSTTVNTGGPTMVQWFNASESRWQTLWEAAPQDNWRDHVGRMLVRTLANGKRVVIPVEGY